MMKLNDREWKPCRLSKLGKIESGRDIYALERLDGDIPYITSGSQNNGIGYFVNNKNDTYDKGYIAFNRNGAVGLAFYHPYWSVMGNDCRKLHLSEADGNLYVGIFVATAISMQSKSFSYSRKLGTGRANKLQIMLPVTDNNQPDYQFMEDYVRGIMSVKRQQYKDYAKKQLESIGLDDDNQGGYSDEYNPYKWLPFYVVEIFPQNGRGKRLKKADHVQGNVPYASSTGDNNGIDGFIDASEGTRVFSDCISLANSGSVGSAFYEPFAFVASDHVTHLKSDRFSKWHYLFLCCVLKQQASNYNFNREINDARLNKMQIMIPITSDDQPDYDLMEKFGKNTMVKKYNQYLKYLKNVDNDRN